MKKICSTCGEEKDLTEYYAQKKKPKTKEEYIYYPPECKECTKLRTTKWGEDNREKKREHWRKHSSLPHKRELQKTLSKKAREDGRFREWQRSNPDKMRVYRLKRAHKEHNITTEGWEYCKEYFNYECAYCGLHISAHFNVYAGELKLTDFHKEHVEHDGANDITNCIPSCKMCNSRKHTYALEEWYTSDNPVYKKERLDRIYDWLFNEIFEQDIV